MGREEDQLQRRNCNCDHDKRAYGKTTYRENYAVPDDDFYEKEDVRWNALSNRRSSGECSHRRVSSIEKETLSSFRQRACQFIESDSNSETESSTLDDCCSHCACSGVMKKAHDLLNYSPESNFLRKLKKQSEIAHEDGCNHRKEKEDIHDLSCACGCRCYMSGIQEEEQHKVDYSNFENEILPSKEQTTVKDRPQKADKVKKSDHEIKEKTKKDEKFGKKDKKQGRPVKKPDKKEVVNKDKTKNDNEENVRPKVKLDDKKKVKPVSSKVPHASRPRKKSPPAKRKPPREIRDVESCGESEASLKRPRPNSCERCWKYASPARSPVNKPLQRYDPNYRRAHAGEGDFNPETKVMELMSPLGSVPKDIEKPPPVRHPNVPRSKSQGTKKNVQVPKPRPQSHTSVRPPATDRENNWDSMGSTQYYEPPEKITVKKKPSSPPKRISAPVLKKDPPLQKKGSKITEKPSAITTKPSSPLKDSRSSKIKTIDIDTPSGKRSHCPCSQRTEKTVPSMSENIFLQKRPKPVERVSSATFTVPRRERPTCHCKSADFRNRLENPEETYVIPSRYSGEGTNRSHKSHVPDQNEHRRPPCHCSSNRQHGEEEHKHRRKGKEHSKRCCCKCHCGAQHCTKQKYMVNDRLFAEPVNTKETCYESDSSDVPCDCGECRRKKRSLQRHCHRNNGNENAQKTEQTCACKNRRNDNNNNNNNNSAETPKKYSVFYMTENRTNPPGNGSGIEVLVEELESRSKNKNSKDKKSSKDIESKIKNIMQYRPDSMALRFQKGVIEKNKPPTSPRVVYF